MGYEEDNDVAVLKIDATGLNAVTLGDSSSMNVGERVYAVGNPLGELDYTMTEGIISALDRVISTEASTAMNVFQISAAVNSGNSGGPVYNSRGEVIGIVTAKTNQNNVEGIGFAIPIDDAINISTSLIQYGYVTGEPYICLLYTSRDKGHVQAVYAASAYITQQKQCAGERHAEYKVSRGSYDAPAPELAPENSEHVI